MKNHLIRLLFLLLFVTQGLVAEEKTEASQEEAITAEEEKETYIKDLVEDYEESLDFLLLTETLKVIKFS